MNLGTIFCNRLDICVGGKENPSLQRKIFCQRFDSNCSYNEADLLEKYRLLSVEGKEVVSATIKLLVKIENGKENVG